MSMSLPYGTAENYRLALALASELTGPAGRTVSEEGARHFISRFENNSMRCLLCNGS
jgi:hypothetical protein